MNFISTRSPLPVSLMKCVLAAFLFCLWSPVTGFAQTNCPDQGDKKGGDKFRFQRPEYGRYRAGTVTPGGLPVVGGIRVNRDAFSS